MTSQFAQLIAADVRTDPYVHFLKSSFLDPDTFSVLNEAWPEGHLFDGIAYGMGGRRGFGNHTSEQYPLFKQVVDHSQVWRDFFHSVNNEDFCHSLLSILAPYAEAADAAVDFSQLRFRDAHPDDRKDIGADEFTVDFNISEAVQGYWREAHHDNPNKIVVFLLYFNDIGVDAGGEFLIYRHKQSMAPRDYERFPAMEDVDQVATVRPQPNLLVGTMNSRNAYHAVRKITSPTAKRRFVYIALGLRHNVRAWRPGNPKDCQRPVHI